MHTTVADCITMPLSRKAKLKGENPPAAKPRISTFSNTLKISFFVRRTVSHLQVHLLFFPVLSRCPCSLSVCLPAYLPVLVFQLLSPICHVSAAAAEDETPTWSRLHHWHPPPYFSPSNVHLINQDVSDFCWFYFSSCAGGQEPAGKAGRACRLPFSPSPR